MEKKTLILDYSRWRCGGGGDSDDEIAPNQLGEGETKLANFKGYCCCLGLFTPQLNPSMTQASIALYGAGYPSDLPDEVPFLNKMESEDEMVNTDLANDAVTINDNPTTTPDEKIKLLKELFAPHGLEIEVINKPE